MIITMRTGYASPRGTARAGKQIDLPAAEAKELIKGGFAVAYKPEPEVADEPPPEAKREQEVETATAPDTPERAAPQRRRGRPPAKATE